MRGTMTVFRLPKHHAGGSQRHRTFEPERPSELGRTELRRSATQMAKEGWLARARGKLAPRGI